MWFALDRPDRRRLHPSHATVVAYLALIVAVLGGTGTAVAATLMVHTRNIVDGAVTNPKIANNAVGNAKIRDNSVGNAKIRDSAVGTRKINDGGVQRVDIRNGAVDGSKVADHSLTGTNIEQHSLTGANVKRNSLTGRQIDESTLRMTRLAHTVTGGQFQVESVNPTPYPLTGATYTQPAHSFEAFSGVLTVTFPATCQTLRFVVLTLRENGVDIAAPIVMDPAAGGDLTMREPFAEQGFLFPATPKQRTFTATVFGACVGNPGQVFPTVDSFKLRVLRHR